MVHIHNQSVGQSDYGSLWWACLSGLYFLLCFHQHHHHPPSSSFCLHPNSRVETSTKAWRRRALGAASTSSTGSLWRCCLWWRCRYGIRIVMTGCQTLPYVTLKLCQWVNSLCKGGEIHKCVYLLKLRFKVRLVIVFFPHWWIVVDKDVKVEYSSHTTVVMPN